MAGNVHEQHGQYVKALADALDTLHIGARTATEWTQPGLGVIRANYAGANA
jgi:hypothetical protein